MWIDTKQYTKGNSLLFVANQILIQYRISPTTGGPYTDRPKGLFAANLCLCIKRCILLVQLYLRFRTLSLRYQP